MTLEGGRTSLVLVESYVHVRNYVRACLNSKFICVHILSRAQAGAKHKTPKLHTKNYIRACLASKFIGMHILSCIITSN